MTEKALTVTVSCSSVPLKDLDGRTFQLCSYRGDSLLLREVVVDGDHVKAVVRELSRCPVKVGGERCGREVGHDGRHMWGSGD